MSALVFGPFRLDGRTESVWRDGDEIRLRPKTFAILRYLAERPRRLVTKEELLEAVWPEIAVGDAALTVCVGEIRKALGDDARTPRFVETVHRRGYRFIGGGAAPSAVAPATPPLVGRSEELNRLHRWLERALRGERQVVFVTGEPGIGKTTLVEAFLAGIGGDVLLGRGQCLDHYGAGEAYLPILDAIARMARTADADRLVAVLRRHAPSWLAQMPSLASAEELVALEPRIRGTTRERMLREMAEALEALAAAQPVVLLLEDLHWSDHSTLDLVAAIARRRDPARLLLVGTYRPAEALLRGHPLGAVKPDLALHGAGDELSLALLDERAVARYLADRFGAGVAERLAPAVHKRTDGLPLFMVTVADALVAQGLVVADGDRWVVRGDEAALHTAVPQSLRQMIEQQLGRLAPDEQRLLEAASVSGVTYSAASVAAALDDRVEAAEDRCEALARRKLFIRPAGVDEWPDGTTAASYRFLHVLYQQVLYERLPAARRAGLHRRIGEREEIGYAARPGERAAALAAHFERSRDFARALRHHRCAAEHALGRHAYPEAIAHLTRGRELLESLPDDDARRALDLELDMTLGPALIALRGSAAAEVAAVYRRARDLAERLGDARLHPALWGLWFVNYGRGRYAEAHAMGQQLLALAERDGNVGQLLESHHALWATRFAMGAPREALVHIEAAHRLYDPERHAAQALVYGSHDAGTCSWYHLGFTRWLLGYPDGALAAFGEARTLAGRLEHPMTTVILSGKLMWVHYYRGEPDEALEYARAMTSLAAEYGFSSYVDDGFIVEAGLAPTIDEPLVRTLASRCSAGDSGRAGWRDALGLCILAQTAMTHGRVDLARDVLAAVRDEQRGAFLAPEIERLHGEVRLRGDARDEAEGCFRRAIEMARARSERALGLRAATSLARLLARTRRGDEGRRILAAVHGSFTEGFETADLRDARTVLAELGGSR